MLLGLIGVNWCWGQSIPRQPSCSVAVDIGHSDKSPGATSARGVGEFTFNQNMAQLLVAKINAKGSAHAFILKSQGLSLTERVSAESLKGADLLVSIHHDSVQPQYLSSWTYEHSTQKYSDRFEGYSLFVSLKNPQPDSSLMLATDIGKQLAEAGFKYSAHHAEKIAGENRPLIDSRLGIYQYDDLIVLKLSPVPAVLLECGVIVNRQEETKLTDPKYQEKMAMAVAAGVEDACRSIATSHR